jgi:hypothetical protein
MFHTLSAMTQSQPYVRPVCGQDYAALRQSGTPASRARVELGLAPARSLRMERAFRAKAGRGEGDPQQPKFARHEAHVAAVMAQGGFCALSERRVGRSGVCVALPLIWPKGAKRG